MDEIFIKATSIGSPTLYLFLRVNARGGIGNDEVLSALKSLGGPLGLFGGLFILTLIGLLANFASKLVVDGIAIELYKKRSKTQPIEQLVEEINKLPISADLKVKLKWGVLHRPIRWYPQWKRFFTRGFILLTLGVMGASIGGYLGGFHQGFELLSHFKLQYLILAIFPVIYFALTRQGFWLLFSGVCLLINLWAILPWYFPAQSFPAQVEFSPPHRVLISNVLGRNEQYDRAISLVRNEQPDFAVFLESNGTWADKLAVLQDEFPYVVQAGGVTVYSKKSLEDVSIQQVVKNRPAILARVTLNGQELSLVATHPHIPTRRQLFKARNQQLAAIAEYVSDLKTPAMVVGDLNTTMWSPYYQVMVKTANLQNSRQGFGIMPTWPTHKPLFYIPIDHCLVSPEIKIIHMRTGPNVGSDHLPIIVDFAVAKSTGDRP